MRRRWQWPGGSYPHTHIPVQVRERQQERQEPAGLSASPASLRQVAHPQYFLVVRADPSFGHSTSGRAVRPLRSAILLRCGPAGPSILRRSVGPTRLASVATPVAIQNMRARDTSTGRASAKPPSRSVHVALNEASRISGGSPVNDHGSSVGINTWCLSNIRTPLAHPSGPPAKLASC